MQASNLSCTLHFILIQSHLTKIQGIEVWRYWWPENNTITSSLSIREFGKMYNHLEYTYLHQQHQVQDTVQIKLYIQTVLSWQFFSKDCIHLNILVQNDQYSDLSKYCTFLLRCTVVLNSRFACDFWMKCVVMLGYWKWLEMRLLGRNVFIIFWQMNLFLPEKKYIYMIFVGI